MLPVLGGGLMAALRRATGSSLRNALVLGQPIANLIVVTLLGDEYMQLGVRLGRHVERSHMDSDPLLGRWIEEHGAPAYRAEPATHLLGRVIPGYVLSARNLHCTPGHVRSD